MAARHGDNQMGRRCGVVGGGRGWEADGPSSAFDPVGRCRFSGGMEQPLDLTCSARIAMPERFDHDQRSFPQTHLDRSEKLLLESSQHVARFHQEGFEHRKIVRRDETFPGDRAHERSRFQDGKGEVGQRIGRLIGEVQSHQVRTLQIKLSQRPSLIRLEVDCDGRRLDHGCRWFTIRASVHLAPLSTEPYRAKGTTDVSDSSKNAPIWAVIAEVEPFSPVMGVEMRAISGEKVMLNFIKISAGAVVPDHHHPHEQAGTVFEGALILTVGGETRTLRRGDAYVIPGGVPHSATTDANGCSVLDIFAPPRADYLPENR